jgi:hypothetical protein
MAKPGRARKDRRYNLKRYYGITEIQYEAMEEAQGGACAICGFIPKPHEHRLCVDHCHNSQEIRGLLCHWCNIALGRFKDDPNIIKAAFKYLTKGFRFGKVRYAGKRPSRGLTVRGKRAA